MSWSAGCCGCGSAPLAALAPAIVRESRFARLLWTRFRTRPGLVELIEDDTPICRCEDVTLGRIKASHADGAAELRALKLRTRIGMGTCQAMMCMPTLLPLLAKRLNRTVEEVGMWRVRPPLVPVRSQDLL